MNEQEIVERRKAVAANEKAAEAAAAEARERQEAWAIFNDRHLPSTLSISRGEKLFQPIQANISIVENYLREHGLRFTAQNLETAFEAVFESLYHIDPRQDYQVKTGRYATAPRPQPKAGAPAPLPSDITRSVILSWPASTLRQMIRRYGSAQINLILQSEE